MRSKKILFFPSVFFFVYVYSDAGLSNAGLIHPEAVIHQICLKDAVLGASTYRHSDSVALLTHFPTDEVLSALPEDHEKKKEALLTFIENGASSRSSAFSPNIRLIDPMLAEMCDKTQFDLWERVSLHALDTHEAVRTRAIGALVQLREKKHLESFALNCIEGIEVCALDLLKTCFLLFPDPDIFFLRCRELPDLTLFERYLGNRIIAGKIAGALPDAHCEKLSEHDFNELMNGMRQSYYFKCYIMHGVAQRMLADICASEHPRIAPIQDMVREMDERITGWAKRANIESLKYNSNAFSSRNDFLDCIYNEIMVRMQNKPGEKEILADMLRNACIKHELSPKGIMREKLLMRLCALGATFGERLCTQDPEDMRTLFSATLLGKKSIPSDEFCEHCEQLPQQELVEEVGNMQNMYEFLDWFNTNHADLESYMQAGREEAAQPEVVQDVPAAVDVRPVKLVSLLLEIGKNACILQPTLFERLIAQL